MNELLDQLEREARERSWGLENAYPTRRLPGGFTEKHYPLTPREQRESRRLRAAFAATDKVEVWLALYRGEAVPARMLNPQVVSDHRRRAFGPRGLDV